MSNGTCVSFCTDSQYYSADQQCEPCDASCASCSGPGHGSCTSCDVESVLFDGTCSATCPSRWFVGGRGSCSPCDRTCASCTGSGARDCTTCLPSSNGTSNPYWLGSVGVRRTGGQCLATCPDGFFEQDTNGMCQRCFGACATCGGPGATACESCSWLTPYFWRGSCYTTCPRGTYNDAGLCRACDASCVECDAPGSCLACPTDGSHPHLVGGQCTCRSGYNQTANACVEIDECLGAHDCFNTESCINTAGSYLCVCPAGFSGNGRDCSDIDECTVVAGAPPPCDPRATCTNTIGSFNCTCTEEGYTGDGFVCTDTDECTLGTHRCDQHADCINREAGYACVCKRGFLPVSDECELCHGGFRCDDVDECALGLDYCNRDRATCHNIPGSFQCNCLEVYQGDGIICMPRPPSLPPAPPSLPPAQPPPPSPSMPPSPPGTWTLIASDTWPGKGNTTVIQGGRPVVYEGTNGWWGLPNAAQVTTCGHLGKMLGGYGVFGAGAYVEKTFTDLPVHAGLRIRLVFTRVDSWRDGEAQVWVDGQLAWRKTFAYMERGSTRACGTMGHSTNNEIPAQVDAVVAHYGDSATIRITSSVTQSGWWWGEPWWGMNDFELSTQVPHPSPPAPPADPGVWTFVVRERWPGASGWVGVPDPILPSTITSCGHLGTMLGGYNVFGPGAYVEKTFSGLPPHSALRITLTFYRVDAWRDGVGLVLVDGMKAYQKSFHYLERGSISACGRGGHSLNNEIPAYVDVTVDHFSDSATVRVTSTTTGTSSFWGMNDMTLSAVLPHPSPPAPPSPPGNWEPEPVYEDRWPGATGWSGTSLAVTTCSTLGTMLGGYQVLDATSHVEKTFTGLPLHGSLRLRMTYTRVDRLSVGLVFVDGAETWRYSFYYLESGSTAACGVGGHPLNNEIQKLVDVTVSHSSDTVTIKVAAEGTEGWFGIQDISLITAVSHPSPPAPPSPPGNWEPEPVYEDRWPGATGWFAPVGTSLAVTTCGRMGTMVSILFDFALTVHALCSDLSCAPHVAAAWRLSGPWPD